MESVDTEEAGVDNEQFVSVFTTSDSEEIVDSPVDMEQESIVSVATSTPYQLHNDLYHIETKQKQRARGLLTKKQCSYKQIDVVMALFYLRTA